MNTKTRCIDPRPGAPDGAREEELALLAGGDLPPDEAARLERHAERCPACRELLAGLRESGAGLALLANDLEAEPGPEEVAALERVRERVREGIGEERRDAASRPPRWASNLVRAAAVLLALLAAAVWLRTDFDDPSPKAPPTGSEERVAELPELTEQGPDEPPAETSRTLAVEPAGGASDARASDPAPGPAPESEPASATADSPPAVEDPPAFEPPPGAPSSEPLGAPVGADAAEPQITIRVVSDDPDIVFYWLVEPEENRDEQTVSS